MSLARLSAHLPDYSFNIYSGDASNAYDDHYWGFWKTKVNVDAYNNANHTWTKWAINTNVSSQVLSSINHPYCVIKRHKWLNFCKSESKTSKVKIFNENSVFSPSGFFGCLFSPLRPLSACFRMGIGGRFLLACFGDEWSWHRTAN